LRLALVVSAKYARLVSELAEASKSSRTPLALHVYSFDESVEPAAREAGASFKLVKSVEELYTIRELERCDAGVVALDEDSLTLSVARVLKSLGIPVVIPVLNTELNRDFAVSFGVKHAVLLDQYILANVLYLTQLDKWVFVNVVDYAGIGVAFYRVWKRGVLGFKLRDVESAVEGKPVKLLAITRHGAAVSDPEYVLEQGDTLVLVGLYRELPSYALLIEKLFAKYEQLQAQISATTPSPPRSGG